MFDVDAPTSPPWGSRSVGAASSTSTMDRIRRCYLGSTRSPSACWGRSTCACYVGSRFRSGFRRLRRRPYPAEDRWEPARSGSRRRSLGARHGGVSSRRWSGGELRSVRALSRMCRSVDRVGWSGSAIFAVSDLSGGGRCLGGSGGHGETALLRHGGAGRVCRLAASASYREPLAVAFGVTSAVVATGLPLGSAVCGSGRGCRRPDFLDGQVGGCRGHRGAAARRDRVRRLPPSGAGPAWRSRGRFREVDAVVWWWLIGALIAITPGFRFIFHYFQLLVPPTAVLAGGCSPRKAGER